MQKIIVYHNNKCGKSRAAVQFLEENNIDFEPRLYLENPLKKEELKNLFSKLKSTEDFIRTKEKEFAELDFEIKNEEDKIRAILAFPKLMQRPIVSTDSSAIIARDLTAFQIWLEENGWKITTS